METRTRTRTFCWLCTFILMDIMCVDSNPLSTLALTQCEVGQEAVLPCTWDLHTELPSASPYIQWQTLRTMVFERMGSKSYQIEAYLNRADVPEEVLEHGNCSLHLRDTRFSDAGIYEGYLLVGSSSNMKRILIQSVQLSVQDHKSMLSVQTGSDLTLNLYTQQAVTVVFQRSGDVEWNALWQSEENSKDPRLNKKDRTLIIRNVQKNDEGTYKVMDEEGLALSTVKVSVIEPKQPTHFTADRRVDLKSSVDVNSASGYLLVFLMHLMYFL